MIRARVLETVQLHKQLIQRLFHVMLVPRAALASNGVQFIDKNDGRLFLPSCGKQLTNTFCASTDENFVEFGSRWYSDQFGI